MLYMKFNGISYILITTIRDAFIKNLEQATSKMSKNQVQVLTYRNAISQGTEMSGNYLIWPKGHWSKAQPDHNVGPLLYMMKADVINDGKL